VANKLYSLSFITEQIEEFAKDRLFSVVSDDCDKMDLDLKSPPNKPQHSISGMSMETPSEATSSSTSVTEAQRCLSLYFALCTKVLRIFTILRLMTNLVFKFVAKFC
jgi:symplekin